MLKPNGFADFYSRSARADGGADVAAAAAKGAGGAKLDADGWSSLISAIGTAIGGALTGVGAVIDSTNVTPNAYNTNGVQNLGGNLAANTNNNALLWVLGGGVLLVILLVLVLRK